jgi:hypothetical protein
MELADIIRFNLLSPMVLAFLLGIVAVLVKSDLKIPEQVYSIISIYLLFAVGLKGGFDLARSPADSFGASVVAAALLSMGITLWSAFLLRRFGRLSSPNAIATAIHYGTVSAVTMSAAITFLNESGMPFEGFLPTISVVMELPAVILGLGLAQWYIGDKKQSFLDAVRTALTGKGFLLLGGGVLIGFVSGDAGYQQVKPFFVDLFPGFLTLFLLEMGTLVGKRLTDLGRMGRFILGFAVIMPLIHGTLGVWLGTLAGLSVGGAMLMGAFAASASYITAPAVVEANIPKADVTFALTASLVITFPFNLTLGLPIYFELARLFAG